MSRLRLTLIALLAAAGLLAAAAAGLYGLVRLSWFERQAAQRLSAALGWPVEIGELAIAYFPVPRLDVQSLSIPATPQPSAAPLVEVAALSVTLPWRTVAGLGGRVTKLELRAPRLHLAQDAAGRGNWQDLAEHLASRGDGGPVSFSIGELAVADGGLEFFAGGGGDKVTVAGLQLSAQEVRPGEPFPFELRLAGESSGQTFHAALAGRAMLDPDREVYAADELTVDGWFGGAGLPLSGVEWDATAGALHADLAAGRTTVRDLQARALGAVLTASGEWMTQGASPSLHFKAGAEAFSPRAAAARLDRALPDTTDPAALTRLALSAEGTWHEGTLSLEALSGELDDSRFSGSATLPAGDLPPRLRLAVDALDVDRYLPPSPGGTPGESGLEGALAALRDALESLDVDAEVTVGELRGAGVLARDLTVRLTPLPPDDTP